MSAPERVSVLYLTPRVRRFLFWMCLLAVLVLALIPMEPSMPTTGWDKSNHMLAFSVLALLACWAYPGYMAFTLLGLLVYGGLIEVLQSFTAYRSAEWADLMADAVGLVVGGICTAFLSRCLCR